MSSPLTLAASCHAVSSSGFHSSRSEGNRLAMNDASRWGVPLMSCEPPMSLRGTTLGYSSSGEM
jgi:hypothetical protein